VTGSTLIIEFHRYRRFGYGGGPLLRWVHLGFISVSWIPMLLDEWFSEKITDLRGVAKMKPHAEMDCFGEIESSREQSKRR
jgi:hypothetical protein